MPQPPHSTRQIIVELAPAQLVVGTRHETKEKLLQHLDRGSDVILDFSTARYIDSSGLGMLITVKKKFRDASRHFAVCALDEDLTVLFEMTRMTELLPPYRTADEARAALAAA